MIEQRMTPDVASLVVAVLGGTGDQGRGLATRLALRYAFEALHLHRVELRVVTFNARAIACYEKCGFVREGLFRENTFLRGKYVDVVPMGILRAEYEKTRASLS